MGKFCYTAKNLTGDRISGVYTASDRTAVVTMIRGKNYFPLQIKEVDETQEKRNLELFPRISEKNLAVFCTQFASMLKAGIPISQAFEIMKSQGAGRKLGKVAADVREKIRQIQAMSEVQIQFDSLNARVQTLELRLEGIDGFLAEDRQLLAMLERVQEACPTGVSLLTADFDYEKVTLAGTGHTDAEIATLVVRLRASGRFDKTHLEMVRDAEAAGDGPQVIPGDRYFSLMLYYPVERPGVAAQAKGGKPQ